MVKFTNGVLRSNIHRVASPPGAQGDHTRYSLVYFCRPEDDVVLKRLEGSDMIPPLADGEEEEEEVKSKDWIIRRALGHRVILHKDAALAAANWDKSLGTEQKSQRAYL
jgi:isopenicillin N synthase-like dioxygenase